MSSLLLLVTLLPMLPAALGPHLNEIFDIFGRLANYHCHQSSSLTSSVITTTNNNNNNNVSNIIDNDQLYLLHLRIGLNSLFHRLYAMYPCNFIAYLKVQYSPRDQDVIFNHTIKPMLDSVRLHPLLVISSKDTEINATRWKKMEHHDVVAECGRFALDRCREESYTSFNSRATPVQDQLLPSYTLINGADRLSTTGSITCYNPSNNARDVDDGTFWSPCMAISPRSPPIPLQILPNLENTSTPSTPNNNRSNSSPPEAAVEATPETTPVKDIRQGTTTKQPQLIGSAAVRALGAFGNGSLSLSHPHHSSRSLSRPSTPTLNNSFGGGETSTDTCILSQKINRLVVERQSVQSRRSAFNFLENNSSQNSNRTNDSWNEDQEVTAIVNSQNHSLIPFDEEHARGARVDFTKRVRRLRFHSQHTDSITGFRRSKSCPNIKADYEKLRQATEVPTNIGGAELRNQNIAESSTQTTDILPYEHLLTCLLDQRNQEQQQQQQLSKQNLNSRLSPTTMLDQYIERCNLKIHSAYSMNNTINEKNIDNRTSQTTPVLTTSTGIIREGIDEGNDEANGYSNNSDTAYQQFQLMRMQLLFERQRREVHAERNRRLLGKLRDSKALEESNCALTNQLRMAVEDIESLKSEIEKSKKESTLAEERYTEALNHWQSKCVEELQKYKILRNHTELLELELKDERKKLSDCELEVRVTKAALFDAAHQLKGALEAANQSDELKRTLDNVQKRFLIFGEAQTKLQERHIAPISMLKQEAVKIQRAYAEELSNLRRQLDARTSLVDALRVNLSELENREIRTELQLTEQQRLLQEIKDRNLTELSAVESKYKAQVEINLLLESQILQLHGYIELARSGCTGITGINLASSVSPKERSPPLCGSLASSSDGSLAFHPGIGIIGECPDSSDEIPNLQAIIEPILSVSSRRQV